MRTKPLAMMLALTLSGCSHQAFPEQYEAIRITRRPGDLGFCLTSGMLLDGSVSLESGVLSGSRAVPPVSAVSDDACLDPGNPCLVESAFTPVQLSGDELDKLRELVEAVPEMDCEAVEGLTCDSCRTTTIAVGDTRVNDSCCGEVNEEFAVAFQALESYLDELAASSD